MCSIHDLNQSVLTYILSQWTADSNSAWPEMGIYRDNLLAIVIRDNFLPMSVIAQNSFDLSITDNAFVKYLVIADKLSR